MSASVCPTEPGAYKGSHFRGTPTADPGPQQHLLSCTSWVMAPSSRSCNTVVDIDSLEGL